jgi:hypothetical protein
MEYLFITIILLLCMEGSQESGQSSHVSADRYGKRVYIIVTIVYGGEQAE